MTLYYQDTVDSGYAWLGRVPSHWEISPLGQHFIERSEIVSDKDFAPLSVTKSGVIPQLDNVAKTGNNDSRKLVRACDFVINSRSDRKGSSGISLLDGSVSVVYSVLEPRSTIHGRFAHHLLRSSAFQEEFYRWGSGIVADLWSTRYSAMKRILLAIPPMGEQRNIARYVDREATRIDDLISEQQRLIEMLRDRRSAVVDNELRADPEDGWTSSALKYMLADIDQGVSPQAESGLADEGSWGVLKSGCVNRGVFREEEHKRLPHDFNFDPRIEISTGDVIVSRASGSPDLVGSCAVVKSLNYHLILSDKLFRLRPVDSVDSRFLFWLLNSSSYRMQVRQAISGARGLANNLPLAELRAFEMHYPAIDEQRKIADRLDEQTAKIDTLIAESERLIELSQERRAALITAAVTGQIDVRQED